MKPHKRPGKAAKAARKITADQRQAKHYDSMSAYRNNRDAKKKQLFEEFALYQMDNDDHIWDNRIFDLKLAIMRME